jgi:hypothetical protein
MLKIRESKKKQGSFFSNLLTDYKSLIDPDKEEILLDAVSLGMGNRIAYQKFSGFTWPLWLSEAEDFYSLNYRSTPDPLLLNSSFREWQSFTNFLSSEELQIDRVGMISGPGNSSWSVEFWYFSNGILYHPQKNLEHIKPERDYKTGGICITGNLGNSQFKESIAGAKSNIDEALVSYEINSGNADDVLFAVVRPYNSLAIGGVNNISFNASGLFLKIDGKEVIAFEKKPDFIEIGSGITGDVDCYSRGFNGSVSCSYGMAAMAIGFTLKKGANVLNLRVTLDSSSSLSQYKFDFSKSFREFQNFSVMRMAEGLKMEVPDDNFTKNFHQCKITLFNNNSGDFDSEKIEGFRNLYFFCYSMNRAGLDLEAEKLFNRMLDKFNYNIKSPEYTPVISASWLLNSFFECYIHKRDPEFLQSYFPIIRKIGDYVYKFSTSIHSVAQLPGNTLGNLYIREATESDFMIILAAMINVSYLSRCMGIFGDEVKYKNEADRIQSIIKNVIEKRRVISLEKFLSFRSLVSLPDAVVSGYKEEDYNDFFSSFADERNFPLLERLSGIDLFSSALVLIHLISLKDSRFNIFSKKFFSLIDDYFTLPEFIDPVLKRGVRGDGNMKIIAALIFIIQRNRVFLDRPDRLELFTAPEAHWFKPGNRIKVDNALTRYGKISFLSEASDDEIKITFTGLPKFIPSDIMINFPMETSIIESDDFILKRKSGNSYIINGWPAVIRFPIIKKNNPAGTSIQH